MFSFVDLIDYSTNWIDPPYNVEPTITSQSMEHDNIINDWNEWSIAT